MDDSSMRGLRLPDTGNRDGADIMVRMDDSSMRGLRQPNKARRNASAYGTNARFLDEGIETRRHTDKPNHRCYVRMDDSSMRGLRLQDTGNRDGADIMGRMDDSSMRGLRQPNKARRNASAYGPNGRFLDEGIETCIGFLRITLGVMSEWTIPR